jgi:acetyl esterase/lipase
MLAATLVAATALIVISCSSPTHVAVPTTTTTTFPKISIPSSQSGPSTTVGAMAAGSCAVPGAPFSQTTTSGSHQVIEAAQNIHYGDNGKDKLDVYEPTGTGSLRPAVLAVHGGGWIKGNRNEVVPIAQGLASAGFVVFNADYPLASSYKAGYPYQVDALEEAVRWIRANAATYHVDPTRIGALGGSAGGTLVALLGTTPTGPCTTGDRVAAVVSMSGPMDLPTLDSSVSSCTGSRVCQAINYTAIGDYAGCAGDTGCTPQLAAASPISHVSSDSAPLYLMNSSAEVMPTNQVDAMAQRLTAASVPHQVTILPGRIHAFGYSAEALPSVVAFFQQWLG